MEVGQEIENASFLKSILYNRNVAALETLWEEAAHEHNILLLSMKDKKHQFLKNWDSMPDLNRLSKQTRQLFDEAVRTWDKKDKEDEVQDEKDKHKEGEESSAKISLPVSSPGPSAAKSIDSLLENEIKNDQEVRFIQPMTLNEFEEEGFTNTPVHLKVLLEDIVKNVTMAPDKRQKMLIRFAKEHPFLFQEVVGQEHASKYQRFFLEEIGKGPVRRLLGTLKKKFNIGS